MKAILLVSAFALVVFEGGVQCAEETYFMIRHNATADDLCLGVPNSRTDDGAPVIFYGCLPEIADQHWSFNGTQLVNRNSGKCMEVSAQGIEEVVQQQPCKADSAQQFSWSGNGDIFAGTAESGKCVDPTLAVAGTELSVSSSACLGQPFKKDIVA